MSCNSILAEYDRKKELYQGFAPLIKSLLSTLISREGIKIHAISSRVKTRQSLKNKIDSKPEYSNLADITDILGIRVITHFSDEVDAISKIISKEFLIDKDNSVDKREQLKPTQFGYLSLHSVVSLNESRITLPEYYDFKELKAEIQIRSILQHTWAEIEHDIGYKSDVKLPNNIIRDFSRMAGQLETADLVFLEIREKIKSYKIDVEQKLKTSPDSINIDNISFVEFVESNPLILEIDKLVSEKLGATLIPLSKDKISSRIEQLFYWGINRFPKLIECLEQNKNLIIARAKSIGEGKVLEISSGISIFYMMQVLIGKTQNVSKAIEHINKMNLGNIENRVQLAHELIKLTNSQTLISPPKKTT